MCKNVDGTKFVFMVLQIKPWGPVLWSRICDYWGNSRVNWVKWVFRLMKQVYFLPRCIAMVTDAAQLTWSIAGYVPNKIHAYKKDQTAPNAQMTLLFHQQCTCQIWSSSDRTVLAQSGEKYLDRISLILQNIYCSLCCEQTCPFHYW